MEQTKTAPASPSFVGLLAALAAPDRCSGPDRSEDGLADDVAELSYGSVRLRQVQAASGPRHSLQGPCDEEVISITEADQPADDDGRMRRQRVTLRLSGSEALQLRARAAESGLTVSAYLRTCILEVESLRAQVKDALARMRAPETHGEPKTAGPMARREPQAAHRWRNILFPGLSQPAKP